jgi:hypothetical protein
MPSARRQAAAKRGDDLPVEVFLDGFPPPMRAIAERLRVIVAGELPDAEERVRSYWRLLGYHVPVGRRRTRFAAWVMLERRHVHLGFPMGVLLDDPGQRLEGRGITKQARWLTYETPEAIDEAVAVEFLRAAAAVAALPRGALR